MKFTIFWNMTPCILAAIEVIFYQTLWNHIVDDSTVHNHNRVIPQIEQQ
jgi:hypothetical protein